MIPFTKMHGLGNDYLIIDGFSHPLDEDRIPELARRMSDRHCGIGADGLILILPPTGQADLHMRIFNADGSEAEMCGNGIRCVGKYAHDHDLFASQPLRIETIAGLRELRYALNHHDRIESITVNLGTPILDLGQLPILIEHCQTGNDGITLRISHENRIYAGVLVSLGNPHFVIFVDDLSGIDLPGVGLPGVGLPGVGLKLERHPAFPSGMNIHFARIDNSSEITMKSWERGSGETRACGTGAAAVCVAGVLTKRAAPETTLHLPGGDLQCNWDQTTRQVFITGPAKEVFSGQWPLE